MDDKPPHGRAQVDHFWKTFCRASKLPETTQYRAWHFGDSAKLARDLVELVLKGPKRATAGLTHVLDATPNVPIAGVYSVVTELDGTPRAVIRTTVVERRKFRDVDAAFAWDEGEGDRTLDDWKQGHWQYFTRECESRAEAMIDAEIYLERFELLYPFEYALNPIDCGARIVPGYIPGGLAASCALQTRYYARHHDFGSIFEAGRMADIGAFLDRFDATRDGVWLVVDGGHFHGSVVIDGGNPPRGDAQLRWFIVDDQLRGQGLGHRLLSQAIDFCSARFANVYLHTFAGLDAARHLYEQHGFRLVSEKPTTEWGPSVLEQRFEWTR